MIHQLHQKRENRWHISFLSQFGKQIWGFTGPIMIKNVVVVKYVQKDKQEACPHIKCSACDVFLSLNEKKNFFAKFHDL